MNARLQKFLLLVLFSLISGSVVRSETAGMDLVLPYSSRIWQVGDYPSDNMIYSVTQTPDGFIWLATQGGLGRLIDGEFEWVPVENERDIGTERITALCLDQHANIWAGTGNGLAKFKDGKTTRYALPKGIDPLVLSLCAGSDGSIWIGTRTGLIRFKDETFALVAKKEGDARDFWARYSNSHIRSIFEDTNRQLWIGFEDHLLTLRDGEVVTDYSMAAFRPDFIRAITGDRQGNIWIGSNSGLLRFKDGQFTQYTKAHGLPDNTVTAIYEDRRGTLWVGTFGGLCRFVDEKLVVQIASRHELFEQILCFFEDREDNLWVGARDGLHQLNAQPLTTYTTRQGLSHNSITSVCEDREGTLCIGTWGGGLNCLRDGKLTVYSTANTNALWNDLVLATHPSRDGGIWFGADYDGGLYRLNNGMLERWAQKEGLMRNAIRALMEDRDGRLFIGLATARLHLLENGKLTSNELLDRPECLGVRCLLQTQDGRIWIGGDTGLTCWSNQSLTTLTKKEGLADNVVYSLLEARDQSLWIGTAYGLNHFKNGKFTLYRTVQRFSEDYAILEVLEDDLGDIWLATRRGIVRLSKKEIDDFEAGRIPNVTWTTLGKGDGMNRVICVGTAKPSAWKGKDGRLWFATTKGLTMVDTKVEIKKNEVPPTVVIRKVFVDKKPIAVSTWGCETLTNYSSNPVNVEPGHSELGFRFTALGYVAPEKNQYRYKLEGIDADWVEAGSRREAFYNNLSPGDYTFHVIACNNDGVWNSLGSQVKLRLLPHFWQTWWFRSLVIGAGLFLAGTSVRNATRKRMQRKLELLEQQHAIEKERARIAQDMHDDLGVRLSEISLLSNLAVKEAQSETSRTLNGRISRASRELVDNLDVIVWAVNPKNDSLHKFAFYLHEFVPAYLETSGVRPVLDLPPNMPDHPLSSELRHNLLLVIKEALHDVVKHAQASEVKISARMDKGTLFLTIYDNGKGFPATSGSAFGNGLINMEARMKKIDGKFGLTSEPGKGTCIELSVPLPLGVNDAARSLSSTPNHKS